MCVSKNLSGEVTHRSHKDLWEDNCVCVGGGGGGASVGGWGGFW